MIQTPASPTIPLPKDLEREVEKVRQNVQVAEAGLKNIKKTREAEEGLVQSLLKQKGKLAEEIQVLETEKKKSEKAISVLRSTEEDLLASNLGLEERMKEGQKRLDAELNDSREKTADLQKREEILASKEEKFAKDAEVLAKRLKKSELFKKEVSEVFSKFQ